MKINYILNNTMCDLFILENEENMDDKYRDISFQTGHAISIFKEFFEHNRIEIKNIDEKDFLDFYDYLHYIKKVEVYLEINILEYIKIIVSKFPHLKYILNDDDIICYAFQQQDYDVVLYIFNTTYVSKDILNLIFQLSFVNKQRILNHTKKSQLKEIQNYFKLH